MERIMWELTIAGVDLYHIFNWFFIYSFFGWLWETCYVSVKKGRFVNRGFINGPLCTIYGCGAVAAYLILQSVSGNLFYLYIGGVVVATLLEYVTSVLMESIFHTSWWDYSGNKFNFQGRICLGASLGWGFFTVLLFRVLHPVVEKIVSFYPVAVGKAGVIVVGAAYLVDFGFSAAAAFKLRERIPAIEQAVEQARDEFLVRMHERLRTVGIANSETLENVRERMENIEVLRELEERRETLRKELAGELETRKSALAAKYGHNVQRFVDAYPNLNKAYRKHRENKKTKQNKQER